ncbi:MAG: ABC transporter substrate-binding protein [bacterium]|nr:ABC transporter substrate-binding protein [bacterium]MDT8365484.1 ABC transporter substrate-binding protein [bacterium]
MKSAGLSIKAVVEDLAPGGTLRAAINFGNAVLVQPSPATGEPRGVSVELAKELASRLGLPLEYVTYESAGKVSEALKNDEWDIAFLAIDPKRALKIAFTEPYVVIEGSYMVPRNSPYQKNEDFDQPGVRIAVGANAAYDLYLSRTLQHAQLVRVPTTPGAVDLFLEKKLEAAAGVRYGLQQFAESNREVRLIDGHFMLIRQAVGVPIGRGIGRQYLDLFIDEMITSGFIKEKLVENGQPEVTVAPAPSRGVSGNG